MKTKYTKRQQLQRLATVGVLAALSLVLMVTIRFPIFPNAPFYEMEFADVPILICSSILSPAYSLITLLVVCLIQALTVSSGSGIIGFVMHLLSSGLMIIMVHLVRNKIKGVKGIVISDVIGIITMTLVMIPMNMWMVSEFMQIDTKGFIDGFLLVCVAFNLIKSTANLTIYSLVSPVVTKEFKRITKI